MKISKLNLRNLFSKGQKPNQEAFFNFFDSFWHKDEEITQSSVKGLESTLSNKLDKGVETTLLNAFNDAVKTSVSGVKGEAFPSSSPTHYDPATYPNGLYEKWDVTTAGTYVNFIKADTNPVEVTTADLDLNQIQIAVTNGVAKKLTKALPQAQNKIAVWVAGNYSSGKQVINPDDQSIYEANMDVTPTDIPGVSAKWDKKVGSSLATSEEFRNKIANKALSPEQLFEIIGDYEFPGQTIQLTQNLPYDGFTLDSCYQGIPGGTYWTYDDSKYAEFQRITAVDLKMAVGTFNIYIYAKSDYTTPTQVIPVTVSSTGIHRHIFATPINPATHKIFVSGGVYFRVQSGANTGAKNIVNGSLNDNPVVALGMLLIGEKDVFVGSKPIMDRLEALENDETQKHFTNYIYRKSGADISNIGADGGTYTIDASGLTITNGGVTIDKQINLNQRYLELKTTLYTDTTIYLGTKNIENSVGENRVEINCATKTLTIKVLNGTGGADSTKVFNFNIVDGRQYIVRFYKLDEKDRIEIIDTITTESDYLEAVRLGQFDKYKFGKTTGTSPIIISQISIASIVKDRPYIVFYGDSITEGNSVGNTSKTPYYKDRFANLIGEKTGRPYLVSGRSAGNIIGVLNRMQTELPTLLPNYVCVTIGTNGSNTEANLNQLVDYCEGLGIQVILNLIPLYDDTTASKNSLIQSVVTSRKLMSIQTNRATSLNSDGITKDDTKFANEAGILIHPNESGNMAIYKRALIDIEKVFTDAGVF